MHTSSPNGLGSKNRRSETETHLRLKRLALLWAQAHGYSACAVEVTLPRCRYRADVAAYRQNSQQIGSTAIFECKQARPDLRRDNGCRELLVNRVESLNRRRQILEKNLRVHYPARRIADSLFAEFDSHDFAAIGHRGYGRVLRELSALQNRLFDCTKFETLIRYRCANLFFVVLPETLFRESEIPIGWGALVERDGEIALKRKPVWHDGTNAPRTSLHERIAGAGPRLVNRQFEIAFEDVLALRSRFGSTR